MSRRREPPARRVAVPLEQLNAIVERTRGALSADDHTTLQAAVDTLGRLTAELETTTTTLERVRRLIFGPRTETTAKILGQDTPADTPMDTPADTPAEPPTAAAPETPTDPEPKRKRRPGHGRNGVDKYPRAPRVTVTHDTLKHGDPCPVAGCTGRCSPPHRRRGWARPNTMTAPRP